MTLAVSISSLNWRNCVCVWPPFSSNYNGHSKML